MKYINNLYNLSAWKCLSFFLWTAYANRFSCPHHISTIQGENNLGLKSFINSKWKRKKSSFYASLGSNFHFLSFPPFPFVDMLKYIFFSSGIEKKKKIKKLYNSVDQKFMSRSNDKNEYISTQFRSETHFFLFLPNFLLVIIVSKWRETYTQFTK